MDVVIACIVRLGKELLIAKMDIKQAYCNMPIHLDDCWLLGMKWARPGVCGQGSAIWLVLIFTALAVYSG